MSQFHPEPRQLEFFVKKPLRPILHLLTPEVKDRFWQNVDVGGPNDCWKWLAGKRYSGYGMFCINGRNYITSRVAITISTKRDHVDFLICHKCDNPSCCNPSHLFCGTDQTNTSDKIRKGRSQMPIWRTKAIEKCRERHDRIRELIICERKSAYPDEKVIKHLETLFDQVHFFA